MNIDPKTNLIVSSIVCSICELPLSKNYHNRKKKLINSILPIFYNKNENSNHPEKLKDFMNDFICKKKAKNYVNELILTRKLEKFEVICEE